MAAIAIDASAAQSVGLSHSCTMLKPPAEWDAAWQGHSSGSKYYVTLSTTRTWHCEYYFIIIICQEVLCWPLHSVVCLWNRLLFSAAWCVKKYAGQKVAIFRQTAANFWQRRLLVLKIVILPLNFTKVGVFGPSVSFLDDNFLTRRQFSDNFATAQNLYMLISCCEFYRLGLLSVLCGLHVRCSK